MRLLELTVDANNGCDNINNVGFNGSDNSLLMELDMEGVSVEWVDAGVAALQTEMGSEGENNGGLGGVGMETSEVTLDQPSGEQGGSGGGGSVEYQQIILRREGQDVDLGLEGSFLTGTILQVEYDGNKLLDCNSEVTSEIFLTPEGVMDNENESVVESDTAAEINSVGGGDQLMILMPQLEQQRNENDNNGRESNGKADNSLSSSLPSSSLVSPAVSSGSEDREGDVNDNKNNDGESERRVLRCSDCAKTFDNPLTLQVHTRLHTGELPYKCKLCGEAFIHYTYLDFHKKNSHGKGKSENGSAITHKFASPKKKPAPPPSQPDKGKPQPAGGNRNKQQFECPVCKKTITRKENLGNWTLIFLSQRGSQNLYCS